MTAIVYTPLPTTMFEDAARIAIDLSRYADERVTFCFNEKQIEVHPDWTWLDVCNAFDKAEKVKGGTA